MDGVSLLSLNRSSLVDGVTDDVHDSSEGLGADGDTNGGTGIDNFLSADESFGGVHGDGADSGVSEMLGDLEDESVLDALYFEGVEDGWDLTLELHVDDGTDDLSGGRATCEICPFLSAAALAVEKRERAPLIMLRINIYFDKLTPSIQLIQMGS